MKYFKDDDILHLVISEEKEAGSVEITPNIIAEINGDGELIGMEILNVFNLLFIGTMRTGHLWRRFLNLPFAWHTGTHYEVVF
ncbi:DUF2283 domain-containing protein [Desulfonema magnum]|nr:DUF2283 domain-containing protein [Desulfonema magnum]